MVSFFRASSIEFETAIWRAKRVYCRVRSQDTLAEVYFEKVAQRVAKRSSGPVRQIDLITLLCYYLFMKTPERQAINPLEFPREYFDAQVHFAFKWSELTAEDLAETLRTKTALFRRMTGTANSDDEADKMWHTYLSKINPSATPDEVTSLLFDEYGNNPANTYEAKGHQGALGYDYLPDTRTVKIHFTNPRRGEKPLSDENMDKRREEFRALLENVRTEHPEAALLMSATWLRSTRHYRELSPPDIAPAKNLMSHNMKFGGNSVWGQFIDSSGNVNQRVYDQFIERLATVKTLGELIDAFPYKTMQAVDPIDKYFEFYGLNGTTPSEQ